MDLVDDSNFRAALKKLDDSISSQLSTSKKEAEGELIVNYQVRIQRQVKL